MRSDAAATSHGTGPIYVGGLDRSGKTTMSGYLTSHPHINIPAVGSNMWTYFYRRYGDLADPQNLERCLAAMLSYKHVRFLEPDRERIVREFGQGPPTYARLFALFLAHHAERAGKPRWGAQTGLIERYAPELFDAYDGLKIIHMVRDPRDRYAASLERWPDGRGRAGGATARWRYSTGLAERHVRRHPEQYLIVRFEDLIEDTEGTLREVCRFLGEEFVDTMLEMPGAPRQRDRLSAGSGHAAGPALLSGEHIGQHRAIVPSDEAAFIELHAGRLMRAHGYLPEPRPRSASDRVRFAVAAWPTNLARMAAWRGVEELQQRFPRRIGRRPGRRMVVGP